MKPIKYKTTNKSQPEPAQVDIPKPKIKNVGINLLSKKVY
jgi:hypothetical protein